MKGRDPGYLRTAGDSHSGAKSVLMQPRKFGVQYLLPPLMLAMPLGQAAPARSQQAMAAVTSQAGTSASADHIFAIDIPAQSLATALEDFNLATGLQLFYDSRLVAGRVSPGVHGAMTADDALARLLVNTSLAPVRTNTGMLSLALQLNDLHYTAIVPATGPTLELDTMHVVAPTSFFIDHRYYAVAVAYALQGALQKESALRHVNYQADVEVWLSRSGQVLQLQFVSGNDDQYDVIAQTLRGLAIGVAPPADLQQPIRIKIHASGAS